MTQTAVKRKSPEIKPFHAVSGLDVHIEERASLNAEIDRVLAEITAKLGGNQL